MYAMFVKKRSKWYSLTYVSDHPYSALSLLKYPTTWTPKWPLSTQVWLYMYTLLLVKIIVLGQKRLCPYNNLHNISTCIELLRLTLFPDKVLPVMSSLLIDKLNCEGMPGIFQLCIGVLPFASCKKSKNIATNLTEK